MRRPGLLGALAFAGGATAQAAPVEETSVRKVLEVEWTALNPARGDASPRAATLWGDRASGGPSGFLVAFADGFSSPPHIHNVTYRAVVLSGEIHNDDAGAEPMWMAAGSFWTQPLGLGHITSARGASVAYVEIDDAPYLVHPVDQAQAGAEKPLNVDVSNLVFASVSEGVDVARLWGHPDDGAGGVMVRLAPGKAASLRSEEALRALSVAGAPAVAVGGQSEAIPSGSVASGTELALQCPAKEEEACRVYVRTARSGVGALVDGHHNRAGTCGHP